MFQNNKIKNKLFTNFLYSTLSYFENSQNTKQSQFMTKTGYNLKHKVKAKLEVCLMLDQNYMLMNVKYVILLNCH